MSLSPGTSVGNFEVVCNREEKYKAKNFIDTAVYRGGDALSGWAFAGLISMGFGLSVIAVIAIPVIILWGYMGYQLGKKHSIHKVKILLKLKTIK